MYADDLLAIGDDTVAVTGVSLHSRAVIDALAHQDGLFTLLESDGTTEQVRVIGSVVEVAHGPGAAVVAVAAPATRAVTLTVTEKGYAHRHGGGLDTTAPSIAHDLAVPDAPRSVAGVLVAGLARRRERGLGGVAVISADNLAANGTVTATVVNGLADRVDPALAEWIDANVTFPSSVVDRIVPATTAADLTAVRRRIGLVDAVPVRAEVHRSWVIEGVPGLPRWDRVGATIVDEIAPFEARKLRTVNAPHTALALLGGLAGFATIDEAATDPALAGFTRALVDVEIAPHLPVLPEQTPPPAGGMSAPASETLARFANPMLGHRCAQVATDTSQKLPQRILAPMSDALDAGDGVARLALVVAAWAAWIARSVRDPTIPLDDPLADRLVEVARRSGAGLSALARALIDVDAVFDPRLAASSAARRAITDAATLLEDRGPRLAAEAST